MKNKIQETEFDFEYTGSDYTEEQIIANGHKQISGETLQKTISNTTVYGDYPNGYKFVADLYENGNTEGINNHGSHNFGKWKIEEKTNTLSIKWDNGWIDTITHAYNVNGNIEFYDLETGNWRTTFKKVKKWIKQ